MDHGSYLTFQAVVCFFLSIFSSTLFNMGLLLFIFGRTCFAHVFFWGDFLQSQAVAVVKSHQELQQLRSQLDLALSAATVAEAQEAMAVNEAREADGRVEQAKMLGLGKVGQV